MNKRVRLIVAAVASFFAVLGMLCICVPLNMPDFWGSPTDVYWYVRAEAGFNVDDRKDYKKCEDDGADFNVQRPLLTASAVIGGLLVPMLTVTAVVFDATAVGTIALPVSVAMIGNFAKQAHGFAALYRCYSKMYSNSPGDYHIYDQASLSVVIGSVFLVTALLVLTVPLIRPNSTPRPREHVAAIAASVVGLILMVGGGIPLWTEQSYDFDEAAAAVVFGVLAVLACVLHDHTPLIVVVTYGAANFCAEMVNLAIYANPDANRLKDYGDGDRERQILDKNFIIFRGYTSQAAGLCVVMLTMFALVLRRLRATATPQQTESRRVSKALSIAVCVFALVGGACVIGGTERWHMSDMARREYEILEIGAGIPSVIRFFGVLVMPVSLFVMVVHLLNLPEATALLTGFFIMMIAQGVNVAHFLRGTAENKLRAGPDDPDRTWFYSGAFQRWSDGGIETVTAGLAFIIIAGLCALPLLLQRGHNSFSPQTTTHKLALALSTAASVCAFVAMMVGLTGREDDKSFHIAPVVVAAMVVMASLSHTHSMLHLTVGSASVLHLWKAVMFCAEYQSIMNSFARDDVPGSSYDFIQQVVAAHSMGAIAMIFATASSVAMLLQTRDCDAPSEGQVEGQVEGQTHGGSLASYSTLE